MSEGYYKVLRDSRELPSQLPIASFQYRDSVTLAQPDIGRIHYIKTDGPDTFWHKPSDGFRNQRPLRFPLAHLRADAHGNMIDITSNGARANLCPPKSSKGRRYLGRQKR